MPYSYGKSSQKKLDTVDPRLSGLFVDALSLGLVDISIVEGMRAQERQDEYFSKGLSKIKWPNGKHNVEDPMDKAKALDAAPYLSGKISWKKEHCIYLAGIVLTLAKIRGLKIRWGGNWDMDDEVITDQKFQDLVHYELIEG